MLPCSMLIKLVGLVQMLDDDLLSPWNFPGKKTEVGWHFLLQGISTTQGSNLQWQVDSLPLSHQGFPH